MARGDPAQRLRQALDLIDLTLRMFRQRLRRGNPSITDDEVDAELTRWLHLSWAAWP